MRTNHDNPIQYLADHVWEHPSCYAGFSPDGDYLIVAQHRESDSISRSNFTCAFRDLREATKGFADPPEERLQGGFAQPRGKLSPRSSGWVYDFRTSHSLVGWLEYLMVRKDAPERVLKVAGHIVESIEDYPILDEDHQSELEYDEASEYWASMSVRDRLDIMEGSGVSCFAARHAYLPRDDNGYIYERLTQR